jgi:biopolymer transport protein ExbD
MSQGLQDGDDEITGINVTPLVDVMLVLLVIFMVTATYIVNQSINVNLPEADTGETIEKVKNLAFVIDAEGNLFLNGNPVEYKELPELISREH